MSPETKSELLLTALRSSKTRDQYLALRYLGGTDQRYVNDLAFQELLIVDAALKATFEPAVVSAVVSCLKSENSDIRVEAVKTLSRAGAVAMPPIITLLRGQTWSLDARVGTVVNLLSRTGLKDSEAKILTETIKQPDLRDLYNGVNAFLRGEIISERVEERSEKHCPSCDNILPADAIRCNKCGQKFV